MYNAFFVNKLQDFELDDASRKYIELLNLKVQYESETHSNITDDFINGIKMSLVMCGQITAGDPNT